MSIVELFVICGCALGIITLIVIAIYQRCHYKHNIVDMSDSIRIMQSIINKIKCGDVKSSTNDNVSLNLSFDEFREVLEKVYKGNVVASVPVGGTANAYIARDVINKTIDVLY